MNTFSKLQMLQKYLPKAALQPMTPEASSGVPNSMLWQEWILIHHFPFRVGRESRVIWRGSRVQRIERPKQDESEPNNDLYLVDSGELLNISRKHFQIENRPEGCFLVDRGSDCGTIVGGEPVGGSEADCTRPLRDGELIVVGEKTSPYVYRFVSFESCEVVCTQDGVDQ